MTNARRYVQQFGLCAKGLASADFHKIPSVLLTARKIVFRLQCKALEPLYGGVIREVTASEDYEQFLGVSCLFGFFFCLRRLQLLRRWLAAVSLFALPLTLFLSPVSKKKCVWCREASDEFTSLCKQSPANLWLYKDESADQV